MEACKKYPTIVPLMPFTAARSQEMKILRSMIAATSASKLAFQTVPKHMRRRCMAHNVKRLPRRLRQIHLHQMKKSGLPPTTKRPNRKHRRRPKNLLKERLRRQQRIKWLYTHIWHAKRFHMCEKWGYRLPYCPCDKSFRSCYRAISNYSLMQDISYHKCIQLTGNENVLIQGLTELHRPNIGCKITGRSFLNGQREGTTTLFSVTGKPIGNIQIIWWKNRRQAETIKNMWIWAHCAYFTEMLETFIEFFKLTKQSDNDDLYSSNRVQLMLVSGVCRYKLIGPSSLDIIQNSLHAIDINQNDNIEWMRRFQTLCNNEFSQQQRCYQALSSTHWYSFLPTRVVLSVIVKNPESSSRKSTTQPVARNVNALFFGEHDTLSISPLYENIAHGNIYNERKATAKQELELRNQALVPGTVITDTVDFVPVILIQQPGIRNENSDFASGWDIILPSAKAQSIWLSLIMNGCRVGGLRENENIQFEMGIQSLLLPDTAAGYEEEKLISETCKNVYFRKPPNKRFNYNKFAISSPFNWNWQMLINEWAPQSVPQGGFFVVRDKHILNTLQAFLKANVDSIPQSLHNCLVPVHLKALSKGIPKQFSIICLPTDKDVECPPIEPKRKDPFQEKRHATRKNHQTLLKTLRRRRVRAKKTGKIIDVDRSVLVEYQKEMRSLWLPEPTTIRNSSSRTVLGFVKHGGFHYIKGVPAAIGYVPIEAFKALQDQKQRNKVLFRNTNSRQYYFALMNVIVE